MENRRGERLLDGFDAELCARGAVHLGAAGECAPCAGVQLAVARDQSEAEGASHAVCVARAVGGLRQRAGLARLWQCGVYSCTEADGMSRAVVSGHFRQRRVGTS